MIQITIKEDPPNKQGNMDAPDLVAELDSLRENKLKSRLISSDTRIEIELYYHQLRYKRIGYDNTYIGDLDNLVAGICDILKNRIIIDDGQISEIQAKRFIIPDSNLEERYVIKIEFE